MIICYSVTLLHLFFSRLIAEQNEIECRREQEASDLSSQRDVLTAKLTELEEQVQSLNFSLQQKEKHTQVYNRTLIYLNAHIDFMWP